MGKTLSPLACRMHLQSVNTNAFPNSMSHAANCSQHWASSRLEGHLGMRVSATPLTPKLMHMPHNSAQSTVITVVAASQVQLDEPKIRKLDELD